MMDKLKMHTPNLADENFRKLTELFPNAVTETIDEDGQVVRAIDADVLRQEIATHVVEGRQERYQFTWPDKRRAILTANAPINKTLRPCPAESVGRDGTPGGFDSENLYIEGDNLEVLKLLQETYLGRIKMIYIDPPYNTGNDFVYEDDFAEDAGEYLANSGQYDEAGNRLVQNTESNGRFHTDWLNMMYPRLKLAKNLLSYDGVIFISIDDGEVENLRKICNEVFGDSNFIATFTWQKKYGPANDAKGVSATHEYILLYGKNSLEWNPDLLQRNEDQLKAYKNPDNDPRGIWRASDLSARTYSPSCDYEIIGPTGLRFLPPPSRSWIVNREGFERLLADNRITFGADGTGRPMQKKFITEVKSGITPETWLPREKGGDNKIARYELKEIFPENIFDTPKPSKLLVYLCRIAGLASDSTVMDFFSGSATTAHAVMQLNAEDGGHRKFIMVQLPEKTDEKSEAYKAGYKNICEIGKERIRRAGAKIKEDNPLTTQDLDVGFRVLKCDSSNMKPVYYTPAETEQGQMDLLADSIKEDRTPEDLLFQVMLDMGVELSSSIEVTEIAGKKVFDVGHNFLLACFDRNVTEETVTAVAKRKPSYFAMRDSSMADDTVAANFEQIFKTHSPDTVRRVL